MNYSTEIEQLKAEAPAIVRRAMERGELRLGPRIVHTQAKPPTGFRPKRNRVYREFAHLPRDLYRLNADLKRSAKAHGRPFKLVTELPQPKPGELYLKEWIAAQAEKLEINVQAAWMRYLRGKMAPSQIRRVTKRTIFVVP